MGNGEGRRRKEKDNERNGERNRRKEMHFRNKDALTDKKVRN